MRKTFQQTANARAILGKYDRVAAKNLGLSITQLKQQRKEFSRIVAGEYAVHIENLKSRGLIMSDDFVWD